MNLAEADEDANCKLVDICFLLMMLVGTLLLLGKTSKEKFRFLSFIARIR